MILIYDLQYSKSQRPQGLSIDDYVDFIRLPPPLNSKDKWEKAIEDCTTIEKFNWYIAHIMSETIQIKYNEMRKREEKRLEYERCIANFFSEAVRIRHGNNTKYFSDLIWLISSGTDYFLADKYSWGSNDRNIHQKIYKYTSR